MALHYYSLVDEEFSDIGSGKQSAACFIPSEAENFQEGDEIFFIKSLDCGNLPGLIYNADIVVVKIKHITEYCLDSSWKDIFVLVSFTMVTTLYKP